MLSGEEQHFLRIEIPPQFFLTSVLNLFANWVCVYNLFQPNVIGYYIDPWRYKSPPPQPGQRSGSATEDGAHCWHRGEIFLPFKNGDCANTMLCMFFYLLPGFLASSRRSTQERGDVDGPPSGRSGLSYNQLQPRGPETGRGGHVTGDAAPETAVAQRGERWARSAQDHRSTRPVLYLFKGQHALVLILFDSAHYVYELWLKTLWSIILLLGCFHQNLRESCWNKAAHFFDLPDFLSWKATGSLTRWVK